MVVYSSRWIYTLHSYCRKLFTVGSYNQCIGQLFLACEGMDNTQETPPCKF